MIGANITPDSTWEALTTQGWTKQNEAEKTDEILDLARDIYQVLRARQENETSCKRKKQGGDRAVYDQLVYFF